MPKPLKNFEKGNGKNKQNDDTTETQSATDGNDVIWGTDGNDNLSGLGGDDMFYAGDGNDILDGGDGSDTYVVSGYGGLDSYNDSGTSSDTQALLAEGAETTSSDWDVILADSHGTAIYLSNFGPDNGIEEISGDGWGNVSIRGTGGHDTLDFSATQLTNIDYINGYGGDDQITGSSGDDNILGGYGNDVLAGGGGDDFLMGGAGSDSFVASSDGTDTIADFNTAEDGLDLSGIELEEGQKITVSQTVTETETNTELSLDGIPFLIIEDTEAADLGFDPEDETLEFFF